MHDIAYIRSNPQEFDAALARRGAEPVADRIVALDAHKREAGVEYETASAMQERAKAAGFAGPPEDFLNSEDESGSDDDSETD